MHCLSCTNDDLTDERLILWRLHGRCCKRRANVTSEWLMAACTVHVPCYQRFLLFARPRLGLGLSAHTAVRKGCSSNQRHFKFLIQLSEQDSIVIPIVHSRCMRQSHSKRLPCDKVCWPSITV